MTEIWKPICGYEDRYEVSDRGRVRSLNYHRTGEIKELKTRVDRYGYLCISLPMEGNRRKHFTIHRLVAIAFIPNPDNKPEVNHKDGNKKNNYPSNLEWVSMKENQRHAWNNGLKEKSRVISSEKGKQEEMRERLAGYNKKREKAIIACNLETGEEKIFANQREAARAINGYQGNIQKVLTGKVKKHKGYTFRYA